MLVAIAYSACLFIGPAPLGGVKLVPPIYIHLNFDRVSATGAFLSSPHKLIRHQWPSPQLPNQLCQCLVGNQPNQLLTQHKQISAIFMPNLHLLTFLNIYEHLREIIYHLLLKVQELVDMIVLNQKYSPTYPIVISLLMIEVFNIANHWRFFLLKLTYLNR